MRLEEALFNILEIVEGTEIEGKRNLWEELLNDCSKKNYTGVSGDLFNDVEKIIELCVDSMTKDDITELYKETEVAIMNDDYDEENYVFERISYDVKMELLECMLDEIIRSSKARGKV